MPCNISAFIIIGLMFAILLALFVGKRMKKQDIKAYEDKIERLEEENSELKNATRRSGFIGLLLNEDKEK